MTVDMMSSQISDVVHACWRAYAYQMENPVWRLFNRLLHGNLWKLPHKQGIIGYIDNRILAIAFSFASCPKLFGISVLGFLDDFRSGQYFNGHYPAPLGTGLRFCAAVFLLVGDDSRLLREALSAGLARAWPTSAGGGNGLRARGTPSAAGGFCARRWRRTCWLRASSGRCGLPRRFCRGPCRGSWRGRIRR